MKIKDKIIEFHMERLYKLLFKDLKLFSLWKKGEEFLTMSDFPIMLHLTWSRKNY